MLQALHAHNLPCTTLLNSEECALSEKKKKEKRKRTREGTGGEETGRKGREKEEGRSLGRGGARVAPFLFAGVPQFAVAGDATAPWCTITTVYCVNQLISTIRPCFVFFL